MNLLSLLVLARLLIATALLLINWNRIWMRWSWKRFYSATDFFHFVLMKIIWTWLRTWQHNWMLGVILLSSCCMFENTIIFCFENFVKRSICSWTSVWTRWTPKGTSVTIVFITLLYDVLCLEFPLARAKKK